NTSSSPKLERQSDFVNFLVNDDEHALIWIFDLISNIHNLSKLVAVLRGNLVAIQSIRFNSDSCGYRGDSRDSVHVYDLRSQYEKEQEIDLFSGIVGTLSGPDAEFIF
ncbi:hypothetical protein PanWU01x14_051710, partial [Parasponia andersonii]